MAVSQSWPARLNHHRIKLSEDSVSGSQSVDHPNLNVSEYVAPVVINTLHLLSSGPPRLRRTIPRWSVQDHRRLRPPRVNASERTRVRALFAHGPVRCVPVKCACLSSVPVAIFALCRPRLFLPKFRFRRPRRHARRAAAAPAGVARSLTVHACHVRLVVSLIPRSMIVSPDE